MPAPTTILLFDDDEAVQLCWAALVGPLRLECFKSWEDFESRKTPELARDAVAFVDGTFSPDSQYGGADIAHKLRALGVRKLYSISSNPKKLGEAIRLFDAVLGTKLPLDFLTLL